MSNSPARISEKFAPDCHVWGCRFPAVRGCDSLCRQPGSITQDLLEFPPGHGLGVEKALRVAAAELDEGIGLFPAFHAFSDNRHAQFRRHADDIAEHDLLPFGEYIALHEAVVQFEHVSHDLLDIPQ